MTRYLGIDYGSKRIGLAVGDDLVRIAAPVGTVDATRPASDVIAEIRRIAAEWNAGALVLGLPLNMDDSEGPQARLTREFGAALQAAAGLPLHYTDERLSSHAADDLLAGGEYTRGKKKARRDGVAAQVLLQEFLDALPGDSDQPARGSQV